jgi:hypothetical protein
VALPGALVSLSAWWTRTQGDDASRAIARVRTDQHGRFVFSDLARGRYFVTVTNGDDASRPRKVNLEEEKSAYLELAVDKASAVSGTVRDAETDRAVAGARLFAMGPGGVIYEAFTEADGSYRLPMPQGDYLLTVAAAGYAPARKGVPFVPERRDFALVRAR